MGNCHQKNDLDASTTISLSNFDFIKPIGRGALGKVWRVINLEKKQQIAIKVFIKSEIPSKESLNSILSELKILACLNSPFLINVHFAFQDRKKLYLGLDLKLGGDLRYHMLKRKFTECEIKFIIACLVLGLEHIHSNRIIHKDLKPENIVLDNQGYAFITDFGAASKYKEENSNENSGTPGYMAPEVICRQNHSFVSDFFAFGVILYECMLDFRPYRGKNRKEIRESILERQVKIEENNIPDGWSLEAVRFCNSALKRKPSQRLGAGGVQQIKEHEWFKDLSFDSIKDFSAKAQFLPKGNENFDEEHVRFYSRPHIKDKLGVKDFEGYFFSPLSIVK